jgi:cysteinyl-tRNA synthetase
MTYVPSIAYNKPMLKPIPIRLTNSLGKEKEDFRPIAAGEVKMYSCGPTVYDHVHIGNLRAFLLSDILRRTFEFNGYKVTQVMNITDVGQLNPDSSGEEEDKMTKGLKRENKPISIDAMKELADFYTERFKENLASLNILQPHIMPKASEHIPEDLTFIKILEKRGYAYRTSDGVYFDTAKDQEYGKLGGISTDDDHARIADNNEKRNYKDFALWKFNDALGYESPWGQGFPGWHIECSAMSEKYLGSHFDIHTGGADLAPIHHNNEIAQSECASGHQFVNYWLHNAFVNIGETGTKMSKSLGNFIKLADLQGYLQNKQEKYSAIVYRYYLLNSHYRSPVNFSVEAFVNSSKGLDKIYSVFNTFGTATGQPIQKYIDAFKEDINDDLNTSKAISEIFALERDKDFENEDKRATLLEFDKVLGLDLAGQTEKITAPEEVIELLRLREAARREKNWAVADEIRLEINKKGFDVKDTENEQEITRKYG